MQTTSMSERSDLIEEGVEEGVEEGLDCSPEMNGEQPPRARQPGSFCYRRGFLVQMDPSLSKLLLVGPIPFIAIIAIIAMIAMIAIAAIIAIIALLAKIAIIAIIAIKSYNSYDSKNNYNSYNSYHSTWTGPRRGGKGAPRRRRRPRGA